MELNVIKEYINNNFIKDGKLQPTTSKAYLYKNHKIVYESILDRTEYLGNDAKFSERIYHILNDLYNKPICIHPECTNSLKFYTFAKPYRKTCSNKCGVFVNKLVKFEKYGDENYNNPNKMLKTKAERDSYTQMVKSHKATCMEKYGVEHHWLDEEINQKRIDTFQINYGTDNPMKSETIQNKIEQTNLEKYGYKNTFQVPAFIEKIKIKTKETSLSKYGVEHYTQASIDVNNGYRWKEYKLPSGKIIKFQGYEDKLLDELLEDYNEDEIITSRKDMPEFWYKDVEGKKRRYFPDVYIPKTNRIYEVKSEYTLNINLETNELKFQSVRDSGYNFNLKIY